MGGFLYVVRDGRISLASRLVDTRLGLVTASRFGVLASQRFGVRFSTQSAQALCSSLLAFRVSAGWENRTPDPSLENSCFTTKLIPHYFTPVSPATP